MKKSLLLIFLASIFLVWCTSKKQLELLEQQNLLLQQQMDQIQTEKDAAAEAATQKESFDNNLKCQERWDVLRLQYNNFASAYYNEYAKTCYVRYYDKKNNNEILEAPMDQMVSIIKETPLPYGSYTITAGVNFRNSPSIKWSIIQKIDPTNVVTILNSSYDSNDDLRYYIDFEWRNWYVSSVAFK